MDTPMLPRDPLLTAEAWALDALRRRPWRDDAALLEYTLADAIWDDLLAAEGRAARWWALAEELAGLGLAAVMCFFALVGLFCVLGRAVPDAAWLAGLITLGATAYGLWERVQAFGAAGEDL